MTTKTKVASVHHFPNGMTMVFDAEGEQIPDLQGRTEGFPARCREHAERFDFGDRPPTLHRPKDR